MKVCTKCKTNKSKDEFYKDSRYENRRLAKCKKCIHIETTIWKKKNPDKCKETYKKSRLKRTYGLTMGGYEDILEKQGGGCAICGSKEHRGNGGRFAVDHNHKTGAIRGLLCAYCNTGIGLFMDDSNTLMSAVRYVIHFADAERAKWPSDGIAGKA